MNRAELIMRRRNVLAFIKADPVSIVLNRPVAPVKTESGGYVRTAPGVSLAPQQARIVQNKRRFNPGLVNSEAGEIPDTDYLLIATHDKDVMPNDTFEWRGDHYRVDAIYGLRTESILATLSFRGPENRG